MSVALMGKAASCFGCSRNVSVSFVVTSAAALNEDLRLEVAAACAFDIVAYMVAVFFGGEPRDSEFAAVDAQPRAGADYRDLLPFCAEVAEPFSPFIAVFCAPPYFPCHQ